MTSIGEMDNMPSITRMRSWMTIYPEFRARVMDARVQRAEAFADRALDIALTVKHKDDVPAAKLAIDMLKWRAEKADPDQYGTKKETVGPQTASINITLHTGVLDSPAPKDIIVDEFGNFKGFDGDATEDIVEIMTDQEIELSRERFIETVEE